MGCGCSNNNNLLLSETKIKKNNLIKTGSKNNENVKSNNIYKNFKFKIDFKENEDELLNNNIKNILLYTTSYNPSGNLFIYLDNAYKNIVETYSFRDTALGLTLIYEKGMKINDYINKDKFFVLINDDFEIYILLDGHGPFGDIIAQKVQDKVFSYFIKEENQDLKDNYEKIFNSLYEEIQNFLVSNDKYNNDNEYDCILSGTSLTIIIKKDNFLYCSNVGNVTCFLYFVDQNIPSRFNIDILTIIVRFMIFSTLYKAKTIYLLIIRQLRNPRQMIVSKSHKPLKQVIMFHLRDMRIIYIIPDNLLHRHKAKAALSIIYRVFDIKYRDHRRIDDTHR